MKRRIYVILRILLSAVFLTGYTSCIMDDASDCCYNVRLEYRYQRYGTLGSNELGYYVQSLREYVFDERDLLVAINDYRIPHGGEDFFSEQVLLPGRYTVIAFGNKNGYEQVNSEEIGVTKKQELLMNLNHPQESGIQGFSDRLYYGHRSFEVARYGVSRIPVDMTHAHNILGVTVRWKDNSGHPAMGGNYTLTLRQVPSLYRYTPEFMVYNGIDRAEFNQEEEIYPHSDQRRINYIPTVSRTDRANHSVQGNVSPNGRGNVLFGQFITFRYRSDSHVMLSIFSNGQRVMKEIDLYRFFTETGISLDYSLCQEYNLAIEIDGDKVTVGLIQVDDWEDGGTL